jgi:hypothetical protein
VWNYLTKNEGLEAVKLEIQALEPEDNHQLYKVIKELLAQGPISSFIFFPMSKVQVMKSMEVPAAILIILGLTMYCATGEVTAGLFCGLVASAGYFIKNNESARQMIEMNNRIREVLDLIAPNNITADTPTFPIAPSMS